MGELEPWIDENFIRSVWFGMGETVNVKMIRDKFSGYDSPTSPFQQLKVLMHIFLVMPAIVSLISKLLLLLLRRCL